MADVNDHDHVERLQSVKQKEARVCARAPVSTVNRKIKQRGKE